VDAPLEVAIARENGGDDEPALVDRGRDVLRQGAAVPDARRAAVADDVEAERLEVREQPDFARYSVTTFEPGARLVFTHGGRSRPFSTAFFASSPAAIITDGFEVFVQLVIAAMTTEPCSSVNSFPSSWTTA
jgi:hypothetical protein